MSDQSGRCDRRSFLEKSIHVSGAGVVAALSLEQATVPAQAAETVTAKATVPVSASAMPTGAIGNLRVSRLICGGNLFAGSAHSRDLIYVSELMKHYYTPEKIMDTLELCESCGVNTAVMRCDDHIIGVLKRYRTQRGGKIQWIAQTYPKVNDLSNIQKAIDAGAAAVFAQGGSCDDLVKDGHLDTIVELLALVKKNGLPAGVGSHSLTTPQLVEKEGLSPDFYHKTFNKVGFMCQEVAEIAAFMKAVQKPWIAFKVLAAGIIPPRDGLSLAFKTGADFVNLGMFDFQVKEDVKIVTDLLAGDLKRDRRWRS